METNPQKSEKLNNPEQLDFRAEVQESKDFEDESTPERFNPLTDMRAQKKSAENNLITAHPENNMSSATQPAVNQDNLPNTSNGATPDLSQAPSILQEPDGRLNASGLEDVLGS